MKRHIILESAPMIEALRMLNNLSGSAMTLFAVDADGHMTGTLTDGDIRRGMLAGADASTPVADIMHRSFRALRGIAGDDIREMRRLRSSGITLLPVLDSDGRITEIVDTASTRSRLPLDAIMMAGGKGERLRPLTLKVPKPLLEVGGKAIIDYNVEALIRAGVRRISVTTNYLAEMLDAHFADPQRFPGADIRCVRESFPMGTIGSAALVDHRPGGATIVMNSDLLTTVDFEEMYLRHVVEQASITVAVIPYNVSVPYAILETDGNRVSSLAEKPSYSFYANAGIYIIDNALLSAIDPARRTDATDLIESTIARGETVTYCPVNGTWIDIGSPVDYRHACELMAHVNNAAGRDSSPAAR